MSNLGYSFIPVHPGEIIKEELQSRGISQKRFAEVVGVSYTMYIEWASSCIYGFCLID